ncbi:MAG: CHAT domain-containing protein [Burkholderiaceae bacterium]
MAATVRINIEAQKKSPSGVSIVLEEWDVQTGKFTPVKGASATLAPEFAVKPALDDPDLPGQPLTAERAIALAARSPVPPEVGAYLYRLIFRGKIAAEWERRRAAPVRLLLRIGREPRLALLRELPWERLQDERGDYLALGAGRPFARWMDPTSPLQTPTVADWPIRMLIVHGAEPDGGARGAPTIAADDEMHALERLLATRALRHEVEYDVLEHPTIQQIVEACKLVRPHVLHIIGHAQSATGGGDLLLWQPAAAGRPEGSVRWNAGTIKNMMEEIAPRLVFLNACRSGATAPAPAGPRPIMSLPPAFLPAGSVGGVGMPGAVPGDLARVFAQTFYDVFLRGRSDDIDAAFLEARRAMTGARPGPNIVDDADWSFPVLTRCVDAGAVLPRSPDRPVAGAADRFVARLPQRREAHQAIRCRAAPAKGVSQHLAVIVGGKGSGKSYLSEWTLQSCRRAGAGVAGVSFDPQDKVDWLDALRWIRDGERRRAGVQPMPPGPVADWPLRPSAFRLFNWGLNQRLSGLATFDPPTDEAAAIADNGRAFSDGPDRSETLTEDTIGAFCDALNAESGDGGLVLKLDQIDGIDRQSFSRVLMDGLVRPIALGSLPKVRLLLVMESERWAEHRAEFDRLALQPNIVHVPYFRVGEFERIARQFSHQWSDGLYPYAKTALLFALPNMEEPPEWGVDVMVKLTEMLRAMALAKGEVV